MEGDLDLIIRKYKGGRREELIPLLQEIQESMGYLSEEAIVRVGRFLGLSTTKIYGLATFYDGFRFIPSGKVHIRICNGTSCFMNGSTAIIDKMHELTARLAGETTKDGSTSYETVSCMGGCNCGPVINVNGEYYIRITTDQLPELLSKLKYITEKD